MLIKYQALAQHLRKHLSAIYILNGHDHFLLEESAAQIKRSWHKEREYKILHLENDWNKLIEAANSYSLFNEYTLIDAHWDKKTIPKQGKDVLLNYLNNINTNCLIIIRTPNVPAKSMNWLSNNENVTLIQIFALTQTERLNWIIKSFQQNNIKFSKEVPQLLNNYTQGNMLALKQIINVLILAITEDEILTEDIVKPYLINQCNFTLYELADACLCGNVKRSLKILRNAYNNQTESILILWILLQQIHQLINLKHLIDKSVQFSTACNQLKIWPQRVKFYKDALSRLSNKTLHLMLHQSKLIDEQIKSGQNNLIKIQLEKLVMLFSTGD